MIDEGRRSVMASPNVKSYNTGKVGAEKVVYTPKDGGKPFTVGRNAFEHSLRGANAEDNAVVGRHLGEALDASIPVGERSENATFRIAPVRVNGEDAHVLFTVVDGKMTEFDVLKGYNTKKNPEGMMSEVGGADAAKAFEVRADSIANLDRAWQERFKPGLAEHARQKGGALAFIVGGALWRLGRPSRRMVVLLSLAMSSFGALAADEPKGVKDNVKAQVAFDIPASLLHRMNMAHAVAYARETGITNAFDRFEFFALAEAGYTNAMEIASRPRGEMAFCDDQLSEKARESLWPQGRGVREDA